MHLCVTWSLLRKTRAVPQHGALVGAASRGLLPDKHFMWASTTSHCSRSFIKAAQDLLDYRYRVVFFFYRYAVEALFRGNWTLNSTVFEIKSLHCIEKSH